MDDEDTPEGGGAPAEDTSEAALERRAAAAQRRIGMERYAQARMLAQRLHLLIRKKGWTQSELARRAGLKRDVISKTISCHSFPTFDSATAMARALGVRLTDLTSAYEEGQAARDVGQREMSVGVALGVTHLPSKPGRVWLSINREVSERCSLEIQRLVYEDDHTPH